MKKPRIAWLVPPSGGNFAGIERVTVTLAGALAEAEHEWDIDLLWCEPLQGVEALPDALRLHHLRAPNLRLLPFPLARYLHTYAPDVLIVPQIPPTLGAVVASRTVRKKPAIISVIHGNVLAEANRTNIDRVVYMIASRVYRYRVDFLVAVSEGALQAAQSLLGAGCPRSVVIYNPIITPAWFENAKSPCSHPWLTSANVPVILGVGRLAREKDFGTLIRAFSEVYRVRRARLIILGEGPERQHLTALAHALGLAHAISLPGYVPNPAPYMKHAAVLVLSSRWEGLPSVLVEAMALGTPVVATDCPFGPREILEGGRWGQLVPIGDEKALAQAILNVLESPPSPGLRQQLRQRACHFSISRSLEAYRALIQNVLSHS